MHLQASLKTPSSKRSSTVASKFVTQLPHFSKSNQFNQLPKISNLSLTVEKQELNRIPSAADFKLVSTQLVYPPL
jgi:hypothetical protein